MTVAVRIVADSTELAEECEAALEELGVAGRAAASADPFAEAIRSMPGARGQARALACAEHPTVAQLLALARAARSGATAFAVAFVGSDGAMADARAIASDLGIVALSDPRELASALALLVAGAERPWHASARGLPALDRARLAPVLAPSDRTGGKLGRDKAGALSWTGPAHDVAVAVGRARELAGALAALRAAAAPPASATAERRASAVDPRAVLDVIFGPPRRLSDPASKSALRPYGVPMPVEEVCASPSRAAAEATRIGFPVRIALASPDLRVWDHPDLAVDGVDNAARVRDVFRQITGLGTGRAPEARILGVTVTATTDARALLHVRMSPLPDELVLARVGFADPHGSASHDETVLVLPAPFERVALALGRLRGASMLGEGSADTWPEGLEPLVEVISVLAAFVSDRRQEVESLEVNPLALLVGGGAEVREACVAVGDAFVRDLDAAPPP